MYHPFKLASALSTVLVLSACGGGGEDTSVSTTATPQLLPTVITSQGRLLNSCTLSPGCSGNPYAPFVVFADTFPAEGAVLRGFVRLQIRGNDLANVELLPASGYLPQMGIFIISEDKTTAWLDLDTRSLPNGPLPVRISAFNVLAGQPGALELNAMSPRTWIIDNPAATTSFSARVTRAPANGAILAGTTRLELRGSNIANAELLPAVGYAPKFGQFNVSADKTFAWLDLDSRAIPDGIKRLRVSAYNVTEKQGGAREIVAMPARSWNFSNGASNNFTATLTTAPVNGSQIGTRITIEVKGNGLKNVELLPATGYTPVLGHFKMSYDGSFGFLDLDTAFLPPGPIDVRVSAFDAASGQPGAKEIVVMPTRRWNLVR